MIIKLNNTKKRINPSRLTSRKNRGLSIIELMVAMFIGLFLLAGISSSYLYSKKSSIERDQYSTLEDNGRIALEILSDTLQHTGYKSKNAAPINQLLTSTVTSKSCSGDDSVLSATDLTANTTVNSDATTTDPGDKIGVVYLGDDSLFTDCSGGALPTKCRVAPGIPKENSKIYNSFFVDSTDNTLKCVGSRHADQQVIAEGVENMQILYGIDSNEDKMVDRYVTANNIGSFENNIASIQIALLVSSSQDIKSKDEEITYTLLNQEFKAPKDKRARAVFSTTISVRNAL